MLPRIIVWDGDIRENLLSRLDIKVEEILAFEGKGAGVDDFRHWINSSVGIMSSRPNLKLVIWEADSLSWECQAVLLKPLEEAGEMLTMYLVVKNENGLALTILSRCMIVNHSDVRKTGDDSWNQLMQCWKIGPAECIRLADQLDLDSATKLINDATFKLSSNLISGVSNKRIAVLNEVLMCSEDLKQKNINVKLAFGDFLLRTWSLIKT